MSAVLIVQLALIALYLAPKTSGDRAGEVTTPREKFDRLDLVGCALMLVSVVLLILGLTFGASYGFRTARCLAPLLLAWPLFFMFFYWETKLPPTHALIPPATWKIPNLTLLLFFTLGIYGWWSVSIVLFSPSMY
jgi:hypothetical protein